MVRLLAERTLARTGRLTKKLDGTSANVDDVISAMLSQNHGRLASDGPYAVPAPASVWSLVTCLGSSG